MLETVVKVAVYAATAITLNELGNKLVDETTGNTNVEETKVPRAFVLAGSMITGAVTAIAVTDVLFSNPEAVVETAAELI
jgi:hypothetical protein|nr:MAG TPA: hypothetical protein [Caudoviricetes sp.]